MSDRDELSRGRPEAGEEIAFWKSIENSNDIASFEQYLRRYPSGRFSQRAAQIRFQLFWPKKPEEQLAHQRVPQQPGRNQSTRQRDSSERSPSRQRTDNRGYRPSTALYVLVTGILVLAVLALFLERGERRVLLPWAGVATCVVALAALVDRAVFQVMDTRASGFEVPGTLAAGMLVVALAPLPYGYYTLLRLVVCGVGAYGALLASSLNKQAWVWALGFVALLFNPLIPIHLDRETWASVDVGTAIVFLIAVFVLRVRPDTKEDVRQPPRRESSNKGLRNNDWADKIENFREACQRHPTLTTVICGFVLGLVAYLYTTFSR